MNVCVQANIVIESVAISSMLLSWWTQATVSVYDAYPIEHHVSALASDLSMDCR